MQKIEHQGERGHKESSHPYPPIPHIGKTLNLVLCEMTLVTETSCVVSGLLTAWILLISCCISTAYTH